MRQLSLGGLAGVFFASWLVGQSTGLAQVGSSQLLYRRLVGDTWQIWQLNLATEERQQITTTPGDKRFPRRSPGGDIAYCTSNLECFRLELGGDKSTPILQDLWPVQEVIWSPDGAKMAFTRFRHEPVDNSNLWVADADGQNRQVLTHDVGVQQNPVWSPDGQWLAYTAGQGLGISELHVVRADGTGHRQLTKNGWYEFLPTWSPNGSKLAYSSDETGDFEIWIIHPDGLGARQLTRSPGIDTSPAWSPDGSKIAFTSNRSGQLEIWLMNADGSNQQILEQAEGGACDPVWQ